MRWRFFITFAGIVAIGWPLAAHGQQASKIYRLGYLGSSRIPNLIEVLQTGLREFATSKARISGQQSETLDTLALGPDAIVTLGTRLSPRNEPPRRSRS